MKDKTYGELAIDNVKLRGAIKGLLDADSNFNMPSNFSSLTECRKLKGAATKRAREVLKEIECSKQ